MQESSMLRKISRLRKALERYEKALAVRYAEGVG
jgi:hypothetical protein